MLVLSLSPITSALTPITEIPPLKKFFGGTLPESRLIPMLDILAFSLVTGGITPVFRAIPIASILIIIIGRNQR